MGQRPHGLVGSASSIVRQRRDAASAASLRCLTFFRCIMPSIPSMNQTVDLPLQPLRMPASSKMYLKRFLLALIVAQLKDVRIARPRVAPGEYPYLAAMAILLVIALLTRVYHLTTLPYNVDGDFADVGLQARALVTGQQQHLFSYGWAAVPM